METIRRGEASARSGTYRAVVARNVHQDVRVVPAVDVSVAVPHAADQVTLQVVGIIPSLISKLQIMLNITIDKAALQTLYLYKL